jgi:hypothetical protein
MVMEDEHYQYDNHARKLQGWDAMKIGHQSTYNCSRHGKQGPGLSFNFPERNVNKHYCMACVLDALDEFCQELTEVKDGR